MLPVMLMKVLFHSGQTELLLCISAYEEESATLKVTDICVCVCVFVHFVNTAEKWFKCVYSKDSTIDEASVD